MRSRTVHSLAAVAGIVILTAPAGAGDPIYRGASADHTETVDEPMRARDFGDFTLGWLARTYSTADGSENSLRCTAQAFLNGRGRQGVKFRFEGEVIDPDTGGTVTTIPSVQGRTKANGGKAFNIDLGPLAEEEDYVFATDWDIGTKKRADEVRVVCDARNRQPCDPDDTTLCLNGGRFQVEVEWDDGVGSGPGMVLSSVANEGTFYFFNPSNADLLVRLLNSCVNNQHFWVFYAATTSVEFEISVTDTQTGRSKVYDNPLGTPAPAITDTSAFATCP